MPIIELSARSGDGMEAWFRLIEQRAARVETMHVD
jgi:hypothetical protein